MKYIVKYRGFTYVEADSKEQAKNLHDDGDYIYKEETVETVEETDDFEVFI